MDENYARFKNDLHILRKQNRRKDFLFAILILVGFVVVFFGKNSSNYKGVIRVQGIIVEDVNGKERILIGAPVPFAKNRARTDTLRIKETWGKRFGEEYMAWYREYNHQANGILILDEKGWDRIIIGDPAPDPIIGKRIGNSTGIIMNDRTGLERTGYGILDVDGSDRVVLGLDHGNGTEGATLSIMPDGTSSLNLNSDEKSIFIGNAAKGNWNLPDKEAFHGIVIKDKNNVEIITSKDK